MAFVCGLYQAAALMCSNKSR